MGDLNRREFLAASTGLTLAAGVPAQEAPPQDAASQDRVAGANETVGIGLIGAGGQGTHHLQKLIHNRQARVLAVCDIYEPRREQAKQLAKADGHHEYRKLLDRKDVDCVWIATPDHWHSRMAIDALEAGKDVYCEKPMARYWHEARDFYRAAVRTKRVVQIGSQDTSREIWWRAREAVRQGRLGKLVWSQTSITRNLREGDWKYGIDLDAGPHNLDWKAFLGPAPYRPYEAERFFRWRKYWDYSGGIATDLFVHVLHSLCIALDNEWPVRAVSAGGIVVHKDRETPDNFYALVDYEGGHTVFVAGTQANEQGLPVVVRGHEATMYLSGSDVVIRPERIYLAGRKEETIACRDVGDAIVAHHKNFLECVKRRNTRTSCDPLLGYKVSVAVSMCEEAWRTNRVVRFDPKTEEVTAS